MFSLYIMDMGIGLHQVNPNNPIWSACVLAQMGVSTPFVHFGISSNANSGTCSLVTSATAYSIRVPVVAT